MNKKEKREKLIAFLILASLVISTISLVFLIIFKNQNDSNRILMLTQCILGIFAFFLPNILSQKLGIKIPPKMYFAYLMFLYCSIILGEVRSFYYKYFFWDDLLHLFSSMMLGALGFSIITLLNKNEKRVSLSPIFIAIFSVTFAVSIGTLWEIYEYTFDGLLNLNMQKFMLEDGTMLSGHSALSDTMFDLMIDFCGATIMAIIGYISLKINKNDWFKENLIIKKN